MTKANMNKCNFFWPPTSNYHWELYNIYQYNEQFNSRWSFIFQEFLENLFRLCFQVNGDCLEHLNKHLPVQSQHGNTRKRCEICSKLTIKASERRIWLGFYVFIVNFEHISYLFLEIQLQVLNGNVCCDTM